MSKLTIAAWAVCVGCIVAALVSLIARPVHWERTVALAVVVGIAAAFMALRDSGGHQSV